MVKTLEIKGGPPLKLSVDLFVQKDRKSLLSIYNPNNNLESIVVFMSVPMNLTQSAVFGPFVPRPPAVLTLSNFVLTTVWLHREIAN